jgi:hypothetical protein
MTKAEDSNISVTTRLPETKFRQSMRFALVRAPARLVESPTVIIDKYQIALINCRRTEHFKINCRLFQLLNSGNKLQNKPAQTNRATQSVIIAEQPTRRTDIQAKTVGSVVVACGPGIEFCFLNLTRYEIIPCYVYMQARPVSLSIYGRYLKASES